MRSIKVVAIYSLDGGVGKTTLATTLSLAKGYVLMVDMDWEKADLSQLFRAPRKLGWLAPFIKGQLPYVHKISPSIYLIPGYEAYELFQREGDGVVEQFHDVIIQWTLHFPKLVEKLRLPVDTVVVDLPAAIQIELAARLSSLGAYTIFMADRRLISRISDVKTDQYRRYMAYVSLVAINMVEKEDIKMAKKIAPVVLKRVKMPGDYYGEVVAQAVLKDRENKKALDQILMRVKTS